MFKLKVLNFTDLLLLIIWKFLQRKSKFYWIQMILMLVIFLISLHVTLNKKRIRLLWKEYNILKNKWTDSFLIILNWKMIISSKYHNKLINLNSQEDNYGHQSLMIFYKKLETILKFQHWKHFQNDSIFIEPKFKKFKLLI
jgi:hypothetical protein